MAKETQGKNSYRQLDFDVNAFKQKMPHILPRILYFELVRITNLNHRV